jgi:hypothetical protein
LVLHRQQAGEQRFRRKRRLDPGSRVEKFVLARWPSSWFAGADAADGLQANFWVAPEQFNGPFERSGSVAEI